MFVFKKKAITYLAVSLALILILCLSIPALRPPALAVLKIPIQLLTLIGREIHGLVFYHHNYIQNEKLKREIDLFRYKLNNLNELTLENNRLKQALSLKQRSPYKLVATRIIARAQESWSSLVIIDKGTFYGIRRGMVAVTYLGLLGRVVETTDNTSKIMLISDPTLGVSGMVQRSRQEGLVSGTLGTNLIMKYLPEDADVAVNDIVITSGLSEAYPKGLLIGTIIEVGEEFSGLSRYAIIKPAVDLSDVEEALVIVQ